MWPRRPHSNALLPVIKPFTPRASSRRCFTSTSCIMQDGGWARRTLLDALFLVIRRRKVCACKHVHIKLGLMRCSTGSMQRDPSCGGGVEVLIQVGRAGGGDGRAATPRCSAYTLPLFSLSPSLFALGRVCLALSLSTASTRTLNLQAPGALMYISMHLIYLFIFSYVYE